MSDKILQELKLGDLRVQRPGREEEGPPLRGSALFRQFLEIEKFTCCPLDGSTAEIGMLTDRHTPHTIVTYVRQNGKECAGHLHDHLLV